MRKDKTRAKQPNSTTYNNERTSALIKTIKVEKSKSLAHTHTLPHSAKCRRICRQWGCEPSLLVESFHVICRCARNLDSGWLLRFVCHSLEKVSCDLHLERHFISLRMHGAIFCIDITLPLLWANEKRGAKHEQKEEPFKKSAKSKWEKLNSFHALPFATCDRCQFSSCFLFIAKQIHVIMMFAANRMSTDKQKETI